MTITYILSVLPVFSSSPSLSSTGGVKALTTSDTVSFVPAASDVTVSDVFFSWVMVSGTTGFDT